jgi:putative sigma-54 modulation protein
MEISIRAHNVEVSTELRSVVLAKVGHLDRFWEDMDRAEVRFHEEHNPRIADKEVCEVTVTGAGHVVRAKAAASDKLVALDRVLDKLEHRMEKLKGRLVDRSHPRHHAHGGPLVGGGSTSGVGPGGEANEGGRFDGGGYEGGRIVKVKSFAIKPMTPEEGAMQMDMLSHDFFFFTNAETGRAAVVYRRNDGQIGLIDST